MLWEDCVISASLKDICGTETKIELIVSKDTISRRILAKNIAK